MVSFSPSFSSCSPAIMHQFTNEKFLARVSLTLASRFFPKLKPTLDTVITFHFNNLPLTAAVITSGTAGFHQGRRERVNYTSTRATLFKVIIYLEFVEGALELRSPEARRDQREKAEASQCFDRPPICDINRNVHSWLLNKFFTNQVTNGI